MATEWRFNHHLLWMMGNKCRKPLCLMVESILDFGSISMHLPFSGHSPGFHQQFFAHHPAPLFGAVAFVGPATAAPTQTLRNAIGGVLRMRGGEFLISNMETGRPMEPCMIFWNSRYIFIFFFPGELSHQRILHFKLKSEVVGILMGHLSHQIWGKA